MRGSNKLPAFANPERPPRVVVVQRCPSMTHEPRVQCAPDEDVPKFFGSKAPGINPMTGKSWETR